jgi:hypothetical protein
MKNILGFSAQNSNTNSNINTNCIKSSIYKPNNIEFSKQGAVSGSSRISKIKNDTIYQYGANVNNANGLKATNYGYYDPNGNTPYFIKNYIVYSQYKKCPNPI